MFGQLPGGVQAGEVDDAPDVGVICRPPEALGQLPVAPGDSYPWRKACGAPSSVVYRFTTQAEGTLVLSNALEASCPLTLVRFARDGADASPVWRADSRAARVPAGEANWEIEVLTGDPRGVQLFTIGAPPVAR